MGRSRRVPVIAIVSVVLAGLLAAFGASAPAGSAPDLDAASVALAPVTTALTRPVALGWRAGDDRMYAAEQGGTIRIVDPATGAVVGTALTLTGIANTGERGLLGLDFSADGTKLYVDYTDAAGSITVAEYTMAGDVAVPGSARVLLSIPHPRTNHNGGQLTIGPDGMLYIGTGDGGGSGDPDLNGQNLNTLLGAILRIDPTPSMSLPYSIPTDNPFVGQAGRRGEIWMYGLRNPWRFTFDRATDDLWIADVGQGLYEEVDFAPAGVGGTNWGWNLREGFHAYAGAPPPGGQDPLFEQSHADGWCSVIGGYVYRGSAIANLDGAYIYGDLCRSVLSAAAQSGGNLTDQADLPVGLAQITTFGEDHDGELYVANLSGTVSKLVAPPPARASVGSKAMLEGDSGSRSLVFPVTLSEPGTSTVTVQYTVSGVTATGRARPGNGADFKTKTGSLTFKRRSNGTTPISKNISVPVYPDGTVEGNETFAIELTSVSGGFALGRATATGTLLDDDAAGAAVTIGVGDSAIVQQAAGSQSMQIPVTLSAPQPASVSVRYTVTPGSATYSKNKNGGGDFGGKLTGLITFNAGTRTKDISLPVWPDQVPDPDHTFTVTLSALTGNGVTMLRSVGTGEILDPG